MRTPPVSDRAGSPVREIRSRHISFVPARRLYARVVHDQDWPDLRVGVLTRPDRLVSHRNLVGRDKWALKGLRQVGRRPRSRRHRGPGAWLSHPRSNATRGGGTDPCTSPWPSLAPGLPRSRLARSRHPQAPRRHGTECRAHVVHVGHLPWRNQRDRQFWPRPAPTLRDAARDVTAAPSSRGSGGRAGEGHPPEGVTVVSVTTRERTPRGGSRRRRGSPRSTRGPRRRRRAGR